MPKIKGRRVSTNVREAPPYRDRVDLPIGTKSLIGMTKAEIRSHDKLFKAMPEVASMLMDEVDAGHRKHIDPVRKAARLKKMYNKSDHK